MFSSRNEQRRRWIKRLSDCLDDIGRNDPTLVSVRGRKSSQDQGGGKSTLSRLPHSQCQATSTSDHLGF